MAILSPSLLSADYMNMEQDIKATVASGVKWLHVDIMDGHFVPNLSFGYSMVKAIRPITDAVLDVHLMIDTPIKYAEEFCKAGADYLTIHVEADTPENIHKTLDLIRSLGVKPGIVVKPKTPAEAIAPYLEKCLDELAAKYDCIIERRGAGLMQGLVFDCPVGEIINKAMADGLILINAGANIIRFVPPLVITKEHVDEMIGILEDSIRS